MKYTTQLRDRIKHHNNLARAKNNLHHFHKLHRQAAFNNIQKIETYNGQKLTPLMMQQADEYAYEVFGDKRYAPWLYFYAVLQGKFLEGWIPANFYSRYVLPDEGLYGLAVTKTFSKTVLNTDALPDVAYLINGILYDKVFCPITLSNLKQIIGKNSHVIIKNNHSLRGRGVFKELITDINENKLNSYGDCVFQQVITQHPFFDDIVIGPLTTIRIATVRNPHGNIECRGAYLKLGRQGHKLYHSDEGIFVTIQKYNGGLCKFGYSGEFKRMTRHPDTKFKFENNYLPRFREATDFCIKLHRKIPHFPIIGWDIAIDREENIKVIEWNAGLPHPGIKHLEGTIGPCFKGLNWEKLKKD